MDTQNNQPKQQRSNPSLMEAHEKMAWKVGEDIITVVGGQEKKPIAFIKLERYDDNKRPVFSCRDLDGNPLAEETSNLYQLKRSLKDKEIALTAAMQDKDEPVQTPARGETPATEQSVNAAKAPEADKGNELKKVRRARTVKQKDNEQNLSR